MQFKVQSGAERSHWGIVSLLRIKDHGHQDSLKGLQLAITSYLSKVIAVNLIYKLCRLSKSEAKGKAKKTVNVRTNFLFFSILVVRQIFL